MEDQFNRNSEEKVRTAQRHAREAAIGGTSAMKMTDECARGSGSEPLSERVERRLQRAVGDAQDLVRIQGILQLHPEFESFLELQALLRRRDLI